MVINTQIYLTASYSDLYYQLNRAGLAADPVVAVDPAERPVPLLPGEAGARQLRSSTLTLAASATHILSTTQRDAHSATNCPHGEFSLDISRVTTVAGNSTTGRSSPIEEAKSLFTPLNEGKA